MLHKGITLSYTPHVDKYILVMVYLGWKRQLILFIITRQRQTLGNRKGAMNHLVHGRKPYAVYGKVRG